MSILRPILLDTEKKFIAESLFDVALTESLFNVTMKKSISVLFISQERMEKLNEWVSLPAHTKKPPASKMNEYLSMQTLIRICAENGEDINRRLLTINLNYMDVPLSIKPSLMKADFMKLKDNFIEYIKKDQLIKSIEEYSSNGKMKPFRRNLDGFIIDRNIYTHGYLHLLDPSYEFVIEYIHNVSKKKVFAQVTTEMLISYNQFYIEVLRLFNTFIGLRQQLGKGK